MDSKERGSDGFRSGSQENGGPWTEIEKTRLKDEIGGSGELNG